MFIVFIACFAAADGPQLWEITTADQHGRELKIVTVCREDEFGARIAGALIGCAAGDRVDGNMLVDCEVASAVPTGKRCVEE